MVSSNLNGPFRDATYSQNLRGCFELIDPFNSKKSASELLKEELPVTVMVDEPDASLGFDPLQKKNALNVIQIIAGWHKCESYL